MVGDAAFALFIGPTMRHILINEASYRNIRPPDKDNLQTEIFSSQIFQIFK
jgi:hypothetical protein